eukprot:10282-Pyramimonas_sp.AAC.1
MGRGATHSASTAPAPADGRRGAAEPSGWRHRCNLSRVSAAAICISSSTRCHLRVARSEEMSTEGSHTTWP